MTNSRREELFAAEIPSGFDSFLHSRVCSHFNRFSAHWNVSSIIQNQLERNMNQRDVEDIVLHDSAVTKSIEDLHENGEEVLHLDSKTFSYALSENNLVFVDFFASW